MNRDLGVWTDQDCALVLIDYQKEMFEVIRSETKADLVELNVLTELFRDWTSPLTVKAREVIGWYFAAVPKVTTEVGV